MAALLSLFGRGSTTAKYEPLPRAWHVSQSVGSKVLVRGGRTKDFSEKSRQHLSSVVELFDPYSELWEQNQVKGETPSPGTRAEASASINNDLFTFGGYDGNGKYNNVLRKLDTKTWRWYQLSPQNAEGAPMPKYCCGMVGFGDNLGVFGGYGFPSGSSQPGSFIKNTNYTDGWTNEFHLYNLTDGMCHNYYSDLASSLIPSKSCLIIPSLQALYVIKRDLLPIT